MTYERLAALVQNLVKMFHGYQSMMLLALLQGARRLWTSEIVRCSHACDAIERLKDRAVQDRFGAFDSEAQKARAL